MVNNVSFAWSVRIIAVLRGTMIYQPCASFGIATKFSDCHMALIQRTSPEAPNPLRCGLDVRKGT